MWVFAESRLCVKIILPANQQLARPGWWILVTAVEIIVPTKREHILIDLARMKSSFFSFCGTAISFGLETSFWRGQGQSKTMIYLEVSWLNTFWCELICWEVCWFNLQYKSTFLEVHGQPPKHKFVVFVTSSTPQRAAAWWRPGWQGTSPAPRTWSSPCTRSSSSPGGSPKEDQDMQNMISVEYGWSRIGQAELQNVKIITRRKHWNQL